MLYSESRDFTFNVPDTLPPPRSEGWSAPEHVSPSTQVRSGRDFAQLTVIGQLGHEAGFASVRVYGYRREIDLDCFDVNLDILKTGEWQKDNASTSATVI